MTQPSLTPPATLAAALARVRSRWLRLTALKSAGRGLTMVAAIAGIAAAIERGVRLPDGAVLGLAVVALAAVAAAVALAVRPLRRRPDDRRVARFVEERYPACGDAIVTAVDVAGRPRDQLPFAPHVVDAASRLLGTLDLDAIVDRRETRRATWRAAGAAIACVLAAILAAPLMGRVGEIVSLRLFPGAVQLTVVPGDLRVPAGKPATIVARVTGRRGTLAHLAAQITLDANGHTVTRPMQPAGDGYQFRVPSVDRSFHYMVSAGPAVSRAYAVTALHPARVERIDLQSDFPSFTGLAPRLDRDGGDVYAPAGTRVRVIVHTDKPVRQGTLAFSQGHPPAALAAGDGRTLAGSMTVTDEEAYRVALVDPDGLTSESVEYFVRVMDDRPPDVHILRPGNDEGITPLQEVPIEARADDDFGIQKMDLVYSVGGGAETVVPFTSTSGTELARVGSHMLAVEDLKVKPGDVIAYYARAWDVPRAKASTMTRSEIFFLEVRPFNEEYSLAISQSAMQAATGTQLEGLISAQKDIISATWNLERRAAAGRSSADIRRVAEAQVELRGRAERAAGTAPPRRRLGGAQQVSSRQPPPAAGDDPVLKAADAMGRAAQELEGQQTAGAIPHEMAALNALLQAQAQIRDRQVAQQQNTGTGNPFGNRNEVDLSSLFDRELKRQQKSNYEDKASVETPPDQQTGKSALDKIRDLARRQEDLTRQQRDLAKSGLDADEAKRQLEKLTRDQEELRRQLEGAGGARGAAGAAGAAGASSAAGAEQEIQSALQQMRDAAADGQKADAAGAAAKGQQAAEALRRAEAQLQSTAPAAQARALGDLQLESQQIAQEQRRIAGEAERLDREGGGIGDARRRLAGDKNQLADRVDALQRSAERLPAAGAAARELAGERLGSRMRTGAQQLRDGTTGGKAGPPEQQLADALDRIARTIGAPDAGGAKGAEKGDTQQLAGDLDEVRDARDRVARLERQMREVQERGARGALGARGAQGARGARGAGSAEDARGAGAQGGGDVADLQRQLDEELRRARDLLDGLQQRHAQSGGPMGTPETHEWSHSAPGTEAFKQDYAAWQSLTADVARALERAETSTAARLSSALTRDRLRAGGSERVPDAYRRQVSRYFEAIAVKQGPGR